MADVKLQPPPPMLAGMASRRACPYPTGSRGVDVNGTQPEMAYSVLQQGIFVR
ncbi:hypothetical protein [Stenotrophomonas rhizophila]|uniref:hypothetical protein n=1 Tax=Stenotrophomonas rhizophila TaxID=216778 RepID=UPI001E626FD7|nr:hypothetical protein [Stenotrophomonas rhizophila]MCC7635504.1 hypothetical protein [Stenotrophomonas rhizophila]MCC7664730.1 hypothetical protein [Stenotrophomonas rhizophila]